MKVAEQVALLNGTADVEEAWSKAAVDIEGSTRKSVSVVWFYRAGAIVRKDAGELIVSDLGGKDEAAMWLGKVPAILAVPEEPEHGPLGDDAALLAWLPVKVVKPEIERGIDEARVSGYEILEGDKAVPVTFLLFTDGETVKVLRKDDAATKATAGLEASN